MLKHDVCKYMHIYIYIYILFYICINMYTYLHNMHTYKYRYMKKTCTHMYIYIYIYIYISMYICICIYIYIYRSTYAGKVHLQTFLDKHRPLRSSFSRACFSTALPLALHSKMSPRINVLPQVHVDGTNCLICVHVWSIEPVFTSMKGFFSVAGRVCSAERVRLSRGSYALAGVCADLTRTF